jgi:FKBP-type peptidyl-prolyl cis-trans isomerase SlyD
MTIAANKVASIQYTVLDEEGQTIDSSEGGEPLVFLVGAQNVIQGLEEALIGKSVGDVIKTTVEPAKAYGEYNPEGVQEVPMAAFEGVEEIETGMAFTAETEQGPMNLIVTGIEGDMVTVDGNHPLAGKALTFDVTVEAIRDATEEELAHGHIHGEDGHQEDESQEG